MPTVDELILPLAVSAAAGLVGTIAVVRRMALASDALSHVALPGIGLAILLRIDPLLGALAALLAGAVLIWAVEYRTRLPTETVIGVIFSAALAVGSLLTSSEHLVEALFGAPQTLGAMEVAVGVIAALGIVLFVRRAQGRLVISLVSADLARTTGIDVPQLNLRFLLAFALTVALGLRFLGVLLMGSLIIIPAATAKHLAPSLAWMRRLSVAIAMLSTLAGSLIAPRLGLAPGPVIILFAAGLFALSLGVRRNAVH